jgi:hypothetical protein
MQKKKRGGWSGLGTAVAVICVIAGLSIGIICNFIHNYRSENEHLDLGPIMNTGKGEK